MILFDPGNYTFRSLHDYQLPFEVAYGVVDSLDARTLFD